MKNMTKLNDTELDLDDSNDSDYSNSNLHLIDSDDSGSIYFWFNCDFFMQKHFYLLEV